MSFKSAAILDLKVKTRSNCKTDIKFEILDPKNHKNDMLHGKFGQTIENRNFKMTDGGHFGFLRIAANAHTFERDTPSYFII